jgi:2-oxo-hept-3-ene-1,7-dioate hydratase
MTELLDPAALALELHASERTRVQIRHFSQRFPSMTMEDSYAIQRAWMQL